MAQNSLIQVRIDTDTKKEVDTLFNDLGMDTPTAIRLFLKQSLIRRGLPFPVTTTDDFYNEYNMKVLKDAAKRMDTGKGKIHELIEDNDV